MLIRKMIIVTGALMLSGATMAQATELGARSILFDNYANQRALEEQAQNRAYQQQFRQQRQQQVAVHRGVTTARHG